MRSLSGSGSARGGDTRVGVLANPSGECEPELLLIESWARDVCVEVVDLGTSAEPSSLPADCGLVIALGGDGTILRALQLAMTNHAAVLRQRRLEERLKVAMALPQASAA